LLIGQAMVRSTILPLTFGFRDFPHDHVLEKTVGSTKDARSIRRPDR